MIVIGYVKMVIKLIHTINAIVIQFVITCTSIIKLANSVKDYVKVVMYKIPINTASVIAYVFTVFYTSKFVMTAIENVSIINNKILKYYAKITAKPSVIMDCYIVKHANFVTENVTIITIKIHKIYVNNVIASANTV